MTQSSCESHSKWRARSQIARRTTTKIAYDAAYRAVAQKAFLNQDFKALAALRGGTGNQDAQWIKTSKVAVLVRSAWDDPLMQVLDTTNAVNSLPAATPRLAYLTTGFHGTPKNTLETSWRSQMQKRWFDHFMKAVADELPRWSRFQYTVTPDVASDYLSSTSIWNAGQATSFPATGKTTALSLSARRGGVLSAKAPAGIEAADRITHKVAPAFTLLAWTTTQGNPAAVFGGIPLSTVGYRGAALAGDRLLLGRCCLRLHLHWTAANFQVHAALFDEDASGARRHVTGGFRGLRGRPSGSGAVDIEFNDAAYVFRKGHRFVLVVENHVYLQPGRLRRLLLVPYFESCTFDVQHSSTAVSGLVLPLTDPELSCRAVSGLACRGRSAVRCRSGSPAPACAPDTSTTP